MTQLKSNGMIDYKGYKIRRVANTRNWCIIKESLHLWRDGTLNALTCSHWATRFKQGLFRTLRDAKATIDGLTTTSIEDDNNEIYRSFHIKKYCKDMWYAIATAGPLKYLSSNKQTQKIYLGEDCAFGWYTSKKDIKDAIDRFYNDGELKIPSLEDRLKTLEDKVALLYSKLRSV